MKRINLFSISVQVPSLVLLVVFLTLVLTSVGCGQGLRGQSASFQASEPSSGTDETSSTGTGSSSGSTSSSTTTTSTSSAASTASSSSTSSCLSSSAVPVTSSLSLWLRADCLSGISDSTGVSAWTDKSESGVAFSQATASKQPTYYTNELNGLPVVGFDGGDCMTGSSGAISYASTLTVMALVKASYFDNNGMMGLELFKYGSGVTSGFSIGTSYWNGMSGGTSSTTGGVHGSYGNGGMGETTDSMTNASYVVISLTKTAAGSMKVYQDLTQKNSGSGYSAIGSPDAYYTLGAGRSSGGACQYYFQGRMAELLIYNSVLSDANRASVVCYLSTKYGLGLAGC